MKKTNEKIIVRHSFSSIIIFEVLNGIPLLLYGDLVLFQGNTDLGVRIIFILLLVSATAIYFTFSSYRLEMQNNTLTYYSAFAKPKKINIADIEMAWYQTKTNLREKGPFIKLIISPYQKSNMEAFYINVKMLSLENMNLILKELPMVNKGERKVKIDPNVSIAKELYKKIFK